MSAAWSVSPASSSTHANPPAADKPTEGQLVSILKSVNELEQFARLQEQTKSSYAMAIRSAAEYAVEVDAAQAEELRQHAWDFCKGRRRRRARRKIFRKP